jgi:hypothetical protein
VLTLANSVDKPSQTSLSQSHLEGRNILTKTDALDRVEGLQGNYLKKSKKRYHYGENSEDALINSFFSKKKYGTYLDDTTTYRFAYYTNNADLGNANQISILKSISAIVIGGSNQFLTINWGFDYSGAYQAQNIYIPSQASYEYGTAEYNIAEYTSGIPIKTLRANASGAGKIVQTGYETTINGIQLSLQKIEIQAKDGKLG